MKTDPQTSVPRNTVLIAGTGRSGTSWLGKIFDSSPAVFYKPQPDDRNRYPWFRDIPSRLDPTPEFDHFREPFAQALTQTFWSTSADLQPRPDFPKHFLRRRPWNSLVFAIRAWRKITRGRAPIVTIPRWMFRREPSSVTLVVKSVISNLRLAWIHRHFPDIKIILLVRHPGGYVNSIFRGARDHGWTDAGKKHRLAGTVLPFPRIEHLQYADAIENGSDFERELIYWIVANEAPILALGDSPSLKLVVYEELCARPLDVAAELFGFAGIRFGESTRRFLQESTAREQPGYYTVYKNPTRSANKWLHDLSGHQISVVDEYLQRCSLKTLWDGHAGAARQPVGTP